MGKVKMDPGAGNESEHSSGEEGVDIGGDAGIKNVTLTSSNRESVLYTQIMAG